MRPDAAPVTEGAPSVPAAVTIDNLVKRFTVAGGAGQFVVLDQVSLSVAEGEFVSIVGPSGCGKSTLLNIIAGIEAHDGGLVRVATKSGAGNSAPNVGYVFQSPRLLNWLTVEDNIHFVLEAQGVPRERWRELVATHLELVGLAGQERNYPLNLSGGMQQRVAIARALVIEPDILLMDEPFSHLDAITARKMRFDLMEIVSRTRPTILFVTHDLSEAVFLSDRIYMMRTKPARIYRRVEIDLPRPRRPEDPAIFELERALVRDFFGVLDVAE